MNSALRRNVRASRQRGLRAATMALGLFVGGWAGGCGGGGGSSHAPGMVVTAPATATTVLAGTDVRVRVTGATPGAVVTWWVDLDGDLSTTDDRDGIAGTQIVDADGRADGTVWTGGTAPGTYTLMASTTGAPVGVLAPAPLTVVTATLATGLFGAGLEALQHVAVRPDGRIVAVGMVHGSTEWGTLSGVKSIDTEGRHDAIVTTWSAEGALEDVWTIRGSTYTDASDVAAGPDGSFVAVGAAVGTQLTLDGSLPGAVPAWPGSSVVDLGFSAQYDAGSLQGGAVFGAIDPVGAADGIHVTCVVPVGDNQWLVGFTGKGVISVGGALSVDLGGGGAAVVRMADGMAPVSAMVVLSGATSLVGIEALTGGDVLVAGTIHSPVVLAPGRPSAKIIGESKSSVFVARFDPNGELVHHFVPTYIGENDLGDGGLSLYGFDGLADGRCVLVGRVWADVEFGPGMARDVADNTEQGFVLRLEPDLSPLWAEMWIPVGEELDVATWWAECSAVAISPHGEVFVGGGTSHRLDFDGQFIGSGSGWEWDAAIVRYDPMGTLTWVVGVVGDSDEFVNAMALDPMGAVVVVGVTMGPATVVSTVDNKTTPLSYDGEGVDSFLLRIDPDGRQR